MFERLLGLATSSMIIDEISLIKNELLRVFLMQSLVVMSAGAILLWRCTMIDATRNVNSVITVELYGKWDSGIRKIFLIITLPSIRDLELKEVHASSLSSISGVLAQNAMREIIHHAQFSAQLNAFTCHCSFSCVIGAL